MQTGSVPQDFFLFLSEDVSSHTCSSSNYLSEVYYVMSTKLDAEDAVVNTTDWVPPSLKF